MPIATGLTGLPDIVTMHGLVFTVDGYGRGTKYDGRNVVYLGILAPDTAPTCAWTGTGTHTLVSGRRVVYQGYNRDTGTQGGVSAPSASSGAFSNKSALRVTLPGTAAAVGVDAQATHWKIYATVDGGDDEYYYVGQVAIGTTTFDFDFSDPIVQTGEMLPVFDPTARYEYIPQASKVGCVFQDSLVLAGAALLTAGTAAVTAASATVTLTGATPLHKGLEGATFFVLGDTVLYYVNEVTSTTAFKLGDGYGNEVVYGGTDAAAASFKLYHNRNQVQFSQPGEPEVFTKIEGDTLFYVQPDDGDYIVGIAAQGSRLVVFKTHSIYALYGTGESLAIRRLSDRAGCAAHASIVLNGSTLVWYGGPSGVWSLGPEDAQPTWLSHKIGAGYSYQGVFDNDLDHAYDYLCSACALDDCYFLTLVGTGDTSPDRVLVADLRRSGICIGYWHNEDALAIGAVHHETGVVPHVQIGGYYGKRARLNEASDNMALPGGTATGTFTGGTAALPADTGASFWVTDSALRGQVVLATSGAIAGEARFIVSNIATVLTLDTAFSAAPTGCAYIVGGFDLLYRTASLTLGTPRMKRLTEALARLVKQTASSSLAMRLYGDQEAAAMGETLTDPSLVTGTRVAGGHCREAAVEFGWRAVNADIQASEVEALVETGLADT